MTRLNTGVHMALSAMDAWSANQPNGAEVKRHGQTPAQRMDGLRGRRRAQIRAQQLDRRNGVLGSARKRRDGVESRLAEIEAEIVRLLKGLRDGTTGDDKVRRGVATLVPELDDLHRVLDSVERDGEAADAMLDLDPATYEEQNLRRFPPLADRLPVVTEAWLLGEDDTDPLDGGR